LNNPELQALQFNSRIGWREWGRNSKVRAIRMAGENVIVCETLNDAQ
jgi:hypothetical protein